MARVRTAATILLIACAIAGGCAQKKTPTRTGDGGGMNAESPAMSDSAQRMSELRRRSRELAEVSQRMPGRSAAEDRQLTAEAFDKSTASLELLGGPSPGGAFRQQLRIIDSTRTFLRGAGANESVSTDSAVDSGLRSLYGALTSVRERLFPTDDKVRVQLDALSARLGELDSVRGPLHSLVVAQSFDAASKAIDTMAQELEGRADATSAAYPAGSDAAPTQPAR
jgi:hypothetical protein